jgi:UDP-2,4-diacetamido-2,4,6-trideoxy-beta-L-altropyranose hydrolase
MKIVIRVDSSGEIGFGHLSRCINLAEELRARGNDVIFVCRDLVGAAVSSLEERLFRTVLLPRTSDTISERADAAETISALAGARPDWMVLDSYSLGIEWETALKPFVEKIAVIDDLADRNHYCDLFVDQNYTDRSRQDYLQRIPDSAQVLIGPRYALLDRQFRKLRNTERSAWSKPPRVLVYAGGSDQKDLTGKIVRSLSEFDAGELLVDVVVGSSNPRFKSYEQITYKGNINIHSSGSNFAQLVSIADLSIGAGGTTTWERMCMGLPSIVVSVATNQEPACSKLAQDGLIKYLGRFEEVVESAISVAVREILADETSLSSMSESNQLIVEGLGAIRVAEVISPSSESEIKIRKAVASDCFEYFNWASDPTVRSQSLNNAGLVWESHKKWYEQKLTSQKAELFVLSVGELPIGQVRFDISNESADISYSLDSLVRGRGWAALCVEKSINAFRSRSAVPLRALVKSDNLASRAVFKRLNFKEEISEPSRNVTQYELGKFDMAGLT